MTEVLFVRHAQPDEKWKDDRTRPLTAIGWEDRKAVSTTLEDRDIHFFYSSPYKRSVDTITLAAENKRLPIVTDERFRERKQGVASRDYLEERWADFSFCEKGGECLGSVQQRNIEALNEVLTKHPHQTIAIGTHGTALSTILHYYDSSFGCKGFKRIWFSMPYVICLWFELRKCKDMRELLKIERGY